ncbi:MAG: S26 family signal peptidase, partial [Dehalococcoidia bacterium]
LLVDGVSVPEPHLAGPMPDDWRFEWRLAPGEYVVLGDNRAASTDSRDYGPVSRDDIIGPVIRRF